jgi:hypothetical protein
VKGKYGEGVTKRQKLRANSVLLRALRDKKKRTEKERKKGRREDNDHQNPEIFHLLLYLVINVLP